MDFKEIVQHRRSIRKFTDEPVTDDELKTLLRAALMSPTGHSKRGWQFFVVRDREQLAKMAKCKEAGADFVAESSVAIVVAYDTAVSDVWIEDASIAAVTIQYQATELGLGSCWSQIRERRDAEGKDADANLRDMLGYADSVKTLCIIGVGHAAVERKLQDEEKLLWSAVK